MAIYQSNELAKVRDRANPQYLSRREFGGALVLLGKATIITPPAGFQIGDVIQLFELPISSTPIAMYVCADDLTPLATQNSVFDCGNQDDPQKYFVNIAISTPGAGAHTFQTLFRGIGNAFVASTSTPQPEPTIKPIVVQWTVRQIAWQGNRKITVHCFGLL